ncbi:GNAT family N-acetyltransferase [Vibrio sp. Of14-4]|uniref:GNAT family N-acetyltransferase n=1 Tax=Vibrio tetraodonis subsp. pristinus TaxID=2695891 RepID=A0A6L8M0Z3_9VIBR|nr:MULTISPECIES: GNAT family N-acetyltransferase [Vibrio]MCG7489663.1 GNAT family N-acetyltransferase [Vibrio sp. Of14-4]MYM60750.1 GNAT family N-acetyltransferase [Vibrio tetraodonis subsp. pristinus]
MVNNKQRYREFCESKNDIPIFSQHWWLDIVCENGYWDVALFEVGGKIVASMPYYLKKRWPFEIITMPRLTHTLGPYIRYPSKQKSFKRLSFEKSVYRNLISQIPKNDYFQQNFTTTVKNILPFFWSGYNSTITYTYIVNATSSEELENMLDPDIKRRRKKALAKGVVVSESCDVEQFYELNRETYTRHNKKIPYSLELVKRLYNACSERASVKLLIANYNDRFVAGGFFVFDSNKVYYLMGGVDTECKGIGGMDLILLEAISFAIKTGRKFDFEGTMVESIESYFRGFATIQTPMFQVRKIQSFALRLRDFVKND